jgi:hypothetical protein
MDTDRPVHVVVAHHGEPIQWTLQVAEAGVPVTVHSKSGLSSDQNCSSISPNKNWHCISRDNVGREAETWVAFICGNYERIREYAAIVFLQGRPWDHVTIMSTQDTMKVLCSPVMLARLIPEACEPFLTRLLHERLPPPFPGRLDMKNAAASVLGRCFDEFSFAPGAQYIVNSAAILSRPYEFWARLHSLLVNDDVNAWEMERLWMHVFSRPERM